MSNWRPWYGELDEDNCLVFGKFKICTTCANPLPSLSDEDKEGHWTRDRSWESDKDIIWHGYCSSECARIDSYGNYHW